MLVERVEMDVAIWSDWIIDGGGGRRFPN